MNKHSEMFLNRYEIYKEKLKKLCNENGLDFMTVIKIAGFVEYANILSEACEWYESSEFCNMIIKEENKC